MYRIIHHRRYFLALSALLVSASIGAVAIWGLKPGIDFSGGTIIEYEPVARETQESFREVFTDAGFTPVLQTSGELSVSIRLPEVSGDQHTALNTAIAERFPGVEERSFETVGPTIGRELRQRAVTATILVIVAIVLYVTWAFRRVSVGPVRPWAYGAATIFALIHDVVIVLGAFAVFGHFFHVEVDSLFVTALLTVLGFSVHDTIVVFDRIRERLLTTATDSFEQTVNESINQTIVRSINTSLTTILVLFALFFFGGESIHYFTLALIIGIIAGTYSSIFVASPLLVLWERFRNR